VLQGRVRVLAPGGRFAVLVDGRAETLAQDAAGVFHTGFVLAPAARPRLLADLARLLSDVAVAGPPTCAMPIDRLIVDLT
jgi:hypothetical protein